MNPEEELAPVPEHSFSIAMIGADPEEGKPSEATASAAAETGGAEAAASGGGSLGDAGDPARRAHRGKRRRKKHKRQPTDEELERRQQWKVIFRAVPCVFLIAGLIMIFISKAEMNSAMHNRRMFAEGLLLALAGGSIFMGLLARDWSISAKSAIRDRKERNEFESRFRHRHSGNHRHGHESDGDGGHRRHHRRRRHQDGASSFEVK